MLLTRVMPCLLLENGKLVKTVQFKNPNYIGDPVNAIKIYNSKEVDELVFLDITATKEDRQPPYDKIAEIANECFMPLTYGGAVKTIDQMKRIYSLGVEKIVICSEAVKKPTFITEAAKAFGSQSVVVAIDVKKNFWGKYEVLIEHATKTTGKDPVDFAKEMEKTGAGEIFLNNIDQDGKMDGYDLNLIETVSKAVNIPVIACGGAGETADFKKAVDSGASAVAAGSLVVYQNKSPDSVLINFPSPKELSSVLGEER